MQPLSNCNITNWLQQHKTKSMDFIFDGIDLAKEML